MQGRCFGWPIRALIVLLVSIFSISHSALKSEKLIGGLTKPLFVTQRPGDNDRLFILEQHAGRIRIYKFSTGTTNSTPFLVVTGISTGGEQGLLGLAFDPGYETNGFFYVNYTTSGLGAAGQTQVARFKANGEPLQAETADPASRTVLVNFAQPEANHNGGWIGFGKDGYLYIASGDGGGSYDRHGSIGNGQSRTTPLGKILRLRMPQGDELRAEAPADNPFKGHATYLESIWAFGLRNPWRCSIDRLTGDLWIGDVGQVTREEIDIIPAGVGGLNFGWRPREGFIATPTITEQPVTEATNPLHDYPRTLGVSVTGGYRYRGRAVPELDGLYIFGDYGSARLWTMRYEDGTTNVTVTEVTSQLNPSSPSPRPIGNVSSFGEDNAGELYICDYAGGTTNAGEVYRIVSTTPPVMRIGGMSISEDKTQIVFTFNASAGKTYEIEAVTDLSGAQWTTMLTMDPPASNTTMTVNLPMSQEAQYFRVKEL